MESCGCIYVDADGPDFSKTKKVIARKEHKCCECHNIIQPKDEYEYTRGAWEGDFSTYKTCLDCLSIRKVFFCESWFYTMCLERLLEHISDMDGKISSECLTKLTPGAREYVCDQIEKYWEENPEDEDLQ